MNFLEVVIYFTVFSFCGWVSETIICSFNQKMFVKRGFLTGPFIPVYGFGGLIIVLLLHPLKNDPIHLYWVGTLSVTILEFVTGTLMEDIFNLKLWDYSHHKIQYKGRIWLGSSMFFGCLCLLASYVIAPFVDRNIAKYTPLTTKIVGIIFLLYFLADTIHSSFTAFGIDKKFTGMRKELETELEYSYEKWKKQRNLHLNWFQRRLLNAYPNLKWSKDEKISETLKEYVQKLRNNRKNKHSESD